MTDTSAEVQDQFDKLMAQKTGSERVEMMFSMFATAKAIVASSIVAARPGIAEAELRAAVFERIYVDDFSPEELAAISGRIRNGLP